MRKGRFGRTRKEAKDIMRGPKSMKSVIKEPMLKRQYRPRQPRRQKKKKKKKVEMEEPEMSEGYSPGTPFNEKKEMSPRRRRRVLEERSCRGRRIHQKRARGTEKQTGKQEGTSG